MRHYVLTGFGDPLAPFDRLMSSDFPCHVRVAVHLHAVHYNGWSHFC